MKKLLSILLCAALVCALSACGAQAAPSVPEDEEKSAAAPEAQAEEPQNTGDAGDAEGSEDAETSEDAGAPEDAEAPSEDIEDTEVPKSDGAAPASEENQPEPPAVPADDKSKSQPVQTEKPAEKPKQPPKEPPKEPKEQPAPKPEPAPEPESAPAADPKTVAQGLVGRPVSELYAAIGRPTASDYSPSCLVDGEDGELYYNGFTVYTTKEGNSETVYAVM